MTYYYIRSVVILQTSWSKEPRGIHCANLLYQYRPIACMGRTELFFNVFLSVIFCVHMICPRFNALLHVSVVTKLQYIHCTYIHSLHVVYGATEIPSMFLHQPGYDICYQPGYDICYQVSAGRDWVYFGGHGTTTVWIMPPPPLAIICNNSSDRKPPTPPSRHAHHKPTGNRESIITPSSSVSCSDEV